LREPVTKIYTLNNLGAKVIFLIPLRISMEYTHQTYIYFPNKLIITEGDSLVARHLYFNTYL
ncbi:unnamed protein product, partial [Brassica rapa subsp. trilocularis]